MQNAIARGLITAASIMLMAGQTGASTRAIAEDPEFRAAWEAYKAITPEARTNQRHFSAFAVSPVCAIARDTRSAAFARHIEAVSPQAICEAVRSRIGYTPDGADHWQTGEETWNRKAGDCEDFAATVRDLCLARGFDAQMVIFQAKTSNAAHAVVIGQSNGTVWISSNGSYRVIENIANAKASVVNELKWYHGDVVGYRVSGQQQRPSYERLEPSRDHS